MRNICKMKVKYRQSEGILSCYNNDYQLDIPAIVTQVESVENAVLYDPSCIFKFIDNVLINPSISAPVFDYDPWVKTFLYLGCSLVIDNKLYVTAVGLKHFFSSFLAIRQMENKLFLDRKQSKFLNWLFKFDTDSFILRTYNIDLSKICKFCRKILNVDNTSFSKNNPEVEKWRNESNKSGEPLEETDEQIDYLVCLAKVAARELRRIILRDNNKTTSQITPLANYNPQEDWESSCPVLKIFIDEILPENDCPLFKVILRNNIFLGNQKRNYRYKPQSCYFISSVIKLLNDKQKILDFLSKIGIGVGDDAINNLEKNQIGEFNSVFWKIPANATVMAVMDNNQTDYTTKNFNPLKDSHHVDCLNVLQVVKPSGNSNLAKDSKSIEYLESSFVDSTYFEKKAGDYFMNCFNTMLLKHSELHPTESLKEPSIQDIIPCGGEPSSLVPDFTIKFFKED